MFWSQWLAGFRNFDALHCHLCTFLKSQPVDRTSNQTYWINFCQWDLHVCICDKFHGISGVQGGLKPWVSRPPLIVALGTGNSGYVLLTRMLLTVWKADLELRVWIHKRVEGAFGEGVARKNKELRNAFSGRSQGSQFVGENDEETIKDVERSMSLISGVWCSITVHATRRWVLSKGSWIWWSRDYQGCSREKTMLRVEGRQQRPLFATLQVPCSSGDLKPKAFPIPSPRCTELGFPEERPEHLSSL